jgi:uncharacterized protein YciI
MTVGSIAPMGWFTVDVTYTEDRDLLMAVRPRHRDYLTELIDKGTVIAAGPWADDLGGFTIFKVEDRAELDELIAQDPYTVERVAAKRHVREWKPLLGAFAQ